MKLRLAAALLAWPIGWAVLRGLSYFPDLVERWYSGGFYVVVRGSLRSVSGVFPVSLSELLLCALALSLGYKSIASVRGLRAKRLGVRELLQRTAYRGVLAAGGLWIAFLLLWGLHHARRPYAWHAKLEPTTVSEEELEAVSTWLVMECNRLRPLFEDSQLELRVGPGGTDPRILSGYDQLGSRVPALAGGVPLLRRPISSPLLSRLGISGIFSPFTGEAHLNSQIRNWVQPFSASHELAHQKGFAREDEANFIAWQVCRASGDPALEYSACLVASSFALSALKESNKVAAAVISSLFDDAVLADLNSNRRFWKAKHSSLTEVATQVNDTYLKSAGSSAGVRSYGRMLDCLVAEWRQSTAPITE